MASDDDTKGRSLNASKLYFREMNAFPLFTPEEEREKAYQIVGVRKRIFQEIFQHGRGLAENYLLQEWSLRGGKKEDLEAEIDDPLERTSSEKSIGCR